MQIVPRCFGCFIRQAESVCDVCGVTERRRSSVLRSVCEVLAKAPFDVPPPVVSDDVYGCIRNELGIDDPYADLKHEYNERALAHYPACRELIDSSDQPLRTALQLALVANVVDFGCDTAFDLDASIGAAPELPLSDRLVDTLDAALRKASSLVYLTDNCGEIVFDRLALELIIGRYAPETIDVVVKGGPWINDVTADDVASVGISSLPSVNIVKVSNGDEGTDMARHSSAFHDFIAGHDLCISKGQANWELLSDVSNIFFLFMAKCPEIASSCNAELGEPIAYLSR